MLTTFSRKRIRAILRNTGERRIVLAALGAIVVTVAIFLRLPVKPAYLIPTVPFLILILSRVLPTRGFKLLSAFVIASPFLLGAIHTSQLGHLSPDWGEVELATPAGSVRINPFAGPIILDDRERRHRLEELMRVFHAARALPRGSVVVAGGGSWRSGHWA